MGPAGGHLSDSQQGRVAELLQNSKHLMDSGRYADAYSILMKIERMTQGYSENVEILLSMVHCAEMLGDFDAAIKLVDDIGEKHPKMLSRMQSKKAQVLERAGRLDECADLLANMVDDDRKDHRSRYELARVLKASGRIEEARYCIDVGRKGLGRWDTTGAVLVAKAYREILGDPAMARDVLDRISKGLARKGIQFHLERAKAHLDSDPALSRDLAGIVLRSDPGNTDAMTVMSSSLSALGDDTRARQWAAKARKDGEAH